MKPTGERHASRDLRGIEDMIMDARHRFAYEVVRSAAESDSDVLEVGFGEGYGAAAIAPHVRSYRGLEVDGDALAQATATAPNVRFELYDGLDIPFEGDMFDLVFALQVIEHVEQVEAWLEQLARVCKPGGTIILTTPNRTHRVPEGAKPWNRFHLVEWSPAELEELLGGQFGDVTIVGISGTEEINAIELRRVRRMRKLARLDPLRLREKLPAALIHRISSSLGRAGARAELVVSSSDFHVHDEATEDSLDVLARIRV